MARYIPYVFHQTWKTRRIPAALTKFRTTWHHHHPQAEHRLWTDRDNLAFLEKHYAWFVPAYKRYPENIMRVDAVRYFIIYHYGGIYVDLDFECLRCIDPLLEEKHCVLACEPAAHLNTFDGSNESKHIVCNAFIAAAPKHPFMEHLIKMLSKQANRQTIAQDPNAVLDLTGPLLVTQAYESYPHKEHVNVEASQLLYPITKEQATQARTTWQLNDAYAIHHWRGTWWRGKNIARSMKRIFWRLRNG